MFRLLLVLFLATCISAAVLSDVNQQCMQDNAENWSSDNLIGVWYQIRKYTLFGGLVPSTSCATMNFTKPSETRLQEYKAKYNDANQPFDLDDDPVILISGVVGNDMEGLLMGSTIAKFYVLQPETTASIGGWDNYKVDAYRMLTPKYIMYTECALRGHTRWLLATEPVPEADEVDAIVKNVPELTRLDEQKFCTPW